MATPQTRVQIPLEQLKQTIQNRLKERGGVGIRGLSRSFQIMDDNGNKNLDRYEFSKALTDIGIPVNKMEFNELLRYFDKNGDGNISFNEFLVAIRGTMSDRRIAIVKKAFQAMDKDSSGVLTLEDLLGRYDAKKHPKVLSGEMTEQQALEELLYSFEGTGLEDPTAPGKRDHQVTYEEFEQYYSAVSSSIDTDDYFVQMMISAWKITE